LKRLLERREGTPNDRIELLSLTSSAYISLNQFSTALTVCIDPLSCFPSIYLVLSRCFTLHSSSTRHSRLTH
jgi:hypothetical protein